MSYIIVDINNGQKRIKLGENDSIEKIESELDITNEFISIGNCKIRKSGIMAIELAEEYDSITALDNLFRD